MRVRTALLACAALVAMSACTTHGADKGTAGVVHVRDAPFGPRIVERVLVANPAAAAMSVIEAPGFETYHLVPASWYFVGATTIVCLAVLTWRTTTLARPD